jgi:putative copper export protein
VKDLADWLYASALSQAIQNTPWVIPALQSVHILALSILFGAALMVNLGALGVIGRGEAGPAALCRRYVPWIWLALGVLAITGSLLVISEPERALSNPMFWTKLAVLALACGLTVAMARTSRERTVPAATAPARLLAIAGLAAWLAVIVCGRWIAYAIA